MILNQENYPKTCKTFENFFCNSYAARYAIEKIAKTLNKIENLEVSVNPVKSSYWGDDITVAGLITTDDLVRTVKDIDSDLVIIPSVMLRPYSQDFLDGKTLDYVKKFTKKEFFVVEDIYSMKEIVEYLGDRSSK